MCEPLADWERDVLESPAYQRRQDAACLENAAAILRERVRKQTFCLRIICRVLELYAKDLRK